MYRSQPLLIFVAAEFNYLRTVFKDFTEKVFLKIGLKLIGYKLICASKILCCKTYFSPCMHAKQSSGEYKKNDVSS